MSFEFSGQAETLELTAEPERFRTGPDQSCSICSSACEGIEGVLVRMRDRLMDRGRRTSRLLTTKREFPMKLR